MAENEALTVLQKFLTDNGWDNTTKNEVVPTQGLDSGRVLHPDTLIEGQQINSNPRNIYNDQGSIVDMDWSKNPFSKLLQSIPDGGQGTITGFLHGMERMLNPNRERDIPAPSLDQGTGGRAEELLSPTRSKNQKQDSLAPSIPGSQVPLPQPRPDYSQPTALDPKQIEDLRKSLLTQAGQWDPNNPNGLSGRMNSPNSQVDQRSQMNLAQQQHDSLRGFDGSRAARLKKGQI